MVNSRLLSKREKDERRSESYRFKIHRSKTVHFPFFPTSLLSIPTAL